MDVEIAPHVGILCHPIQGTVHQLWNLLDVVVSVPEVVDMAAGSLDVIRYVSYQLKMLVRIIVAQAAKITVLASAQVRVMKL